MIEAVEIKKTNPIYKYSDPVLVQKKANDYLGKGVIIYRSTRNDKKYMVKNPQGNMVHFGQMGYEDYTKHKDKIRRRSYLNRATNIKGDWKRNKYSPNNLSINLLW